MFSSKRLRILARLAGILGLVLIGQIIMANPLPLDLIMTGWQSKGTPPLFTTREPQRVVLLDSGMASLKKRLDMISSAKKSIDAEFFIYDNDRAGRLFTQALIKKAKEGVKVRLLLDYSLPVVEMDQYFTTELQKNGISVRYYNKNLTVDLYGAQFRSHRKLMVIDAGDLENQQAITGGRNIGDEYFDLSTEYNFRDSDIFIQGSIVTAMANSFKLFWSNRAVEQAPVIDPPKDLISQIGYPENLRILKTHILESDATTYRRETARARDYVTENSADRAVLALVHQKGAKALQKQPQGICTNTSFIYDYPKSYGRMNVIFDEIRKEFLNANSKIQIESPYLILKSAGGGLLNKLINKGIDLHILTNSLNSTDAFYTSGSAYTKAGSLTSRGAHVWLYSGIYPYDLDPVFPETKTTNTRWGTHSKRAIIDEKTILIGTFNADPRSKNLNAEMALICRDNPELGLASSQDFQRRLRQSVELDRDGFPKDGRSLFFGADWLKILEFYFVTPPASVFDFLL